MFFETRSLRKWFGGLKAVDGVSFHVKPGEICSVIGPNGAGKTTLFNLITGYIKPDEGEVYFKGDNITARSPVYITRKGIAKSFQIVNIFPRLTAYENIMVAMLSQKRKSFKIFQSAKSLFRDECYAILESIGLGEHALTSAGQLPHGNQKRLEVGIAMTMKPSLLVLDEPTAGMAIEEKAGVLSTIKNMIRDQDCTILLIEHDMNVIFGISETIWVMYNGKMITSGSVGDIKNNEEVRKIYLGEKE